jgi:hypothetical protein
VGIDDLVISLLAKGLTDGEISAHPGEIYGAEVPKQTISTITDRVLEGMGEWRNRPLDPVILHRLGEREDPRVGRSRTGRSMSHWRSPSTGPATFSGCGPGSTATERDLGWHMFGKADWCCYLRFSRSGDTP